MASHLHDFAARVETAAGDLLGWQCRAPGCRAVRTVAETKAMETLAQQMDALAREKAEARQRAQSYASEIVEFRCDGSAASGCGVRVRMPRWRAERRCYCCQPCRRRCWRAEPSEREVTPCKECGQDRPDREGH